jgi:hypothetical protein
MYLDTRGIGKLDGTLAMKRIVIPYPKSYTLAIVRRVGIPHLESCTLAMIMVEIMMLTYTHGKFICKIHRKSTLVNDPFTHGIEKAVDQTIPSW